MLRAVAGGERLDDVVEQGDVREAEQRDGTLVVEHAALGAGHELVEHGQRVTDRAAAGTHDERQHSPADGDVLARAELAEVRLESLGRHEPEGVVVGPRADGADHLVGLGRREDELQVLRRLLDDLEQRVEALRRDHVGLVEDEDLEAVAGRREGRTLAQLTGVVDTTVAGRVDLDDVEAPGAAAGELDAGLALAARRVGRASRGCSSRS